jgi:hypothetical protein
VSRHWRPWRHLYATIRGLSAPVHRVAVKADAQPVAGGLSKVELRAEIALGRLDTLVAKRELDLLKGRLAATGEQQLLGLVTGQPVAGTHAAHGHTFDAPDGRGGGRVEQAALGALVGQGADGAQVLVDDE